MNNHTEFGVQVYIYTYFMIIMMSFNTEIGLFERERKIVFIPLSVITNCSDYMSFDSISFNQ